MLDQAKDNSREVSKTRIGPQRPVVLKVYNCELRKKVLVVHREEPSLASAQVYMTLNYIVPGDQLFKDLEQFGRCWYQGHLFTVEPR
jgi:hypothetical protein